jgi:hypothetical protein
LFLLILSSSSSPGSSVLRGVLLGVVVALVDVLGDGSFGVWPRLRLPRLGIGTALPSMGGMVLSVADKGCLGS